MTQMFQASAEVLIDADEVSRLIGFLMSADELLRIAKNGSFPLPSRSIAGKSMWRPSAIKLWLAITRVKG